MIRGGHARPTDRLLASAKRAADRAAFRPSSRADLVAKVRQLWDLIAARAPKVAARARLPADLRLLTSSYKTEKGRARGWRTGVLYLSPATESGANLCRYANSFCAPACLGHSSGRMGFAASRNARLWRTALAIGAPVLFLRLLQLDIASMRGRRRAVRLDGSSDLGLGQILYRRFPGFRFYDYTKDAARALNVPRGYSLTFSASGGNEKDAARVLAGGGNVARVFDVKAGARLPRLPGVRVSDGDRTDLRFLDRRGVVVGLRAKGKLRHKPSRFNLPVTAGTVDAAAVATFPMPQLIERAAP